jgi:hypothetical protein
MKLIDKLLKSHLIYSGNDCPPFMQRWTLVPALITKLFGCRVFLQHILLTDKDLHDHPSKFITIGIKGRYVDIDSTGNEKEYKAPWIRDIPANYIHRIYLYPRESAWTIAIQFEIIREWGFWKDGVWMNQEQYREINSCK